MSGSCLVSGQDYMYIWRLQQCCFNSGFQIFRLRETRRHVWLAGICLQYTCSCFCLLHQKHLHPDLPCVCKNHNCRVHHCCTCVINDFLHCAFRTVTIGPHMSPRSWNKQWVPASGLIPVKNSTLLASSLIFFNINACLEFLRAVMAISKTAIRLHLTSSLWNFGWNDHYTPSVFSATCTCTSLMSLYQSSLDQS